MGLCWCNRARAGAQIPGTRRLQEDTDGHEGAVI
jgi:hypothetical protein